MFDANGDGKISHEEFKSWVNQSEGWVPPSQSEKDHLESAAKHMANDVIHDTIERMIEVVHQIHCSNRCLKVRVRVRVGVGVGGEGEGGG